ncbi:MAG: murein hydrolase activator EnvC family protein [Nitrospinota bacterium]
MDFRVILAAGSEKGASRRSSFRSVLLSLLFCLSISSINISPAPAAPGESAKIKKEKNALHELKTSILREKKRLSKLEKEEHSLFLSLDTISTRLKLNTNELLLNRKKLKAARKDERKIRKQLSQTKKEIKENQALLSETLRRMYKKGQFSYLKLLFSAETFTDFLLRLKYADKLSVLEADTIKKLNRQKRETGLAQKKLTKQKKSIQRFIDEISSRQKKTKAEVKNKKRLLKSIRGKKEVYRQHIKESEKARKELKKLISKMEKRRKSAKKKKKDKESRGLLFKRRKGRLPWPVKGKLISSFGKVYDKKFKARSFNNGIEIRVRKGYPVKAVFGGKIIFADWFRGYGKLIVLDNGDGFYTLYGHLDKLLKNAGDKIQTGDTLGLSGDTDSMNGNALYFGIRAGGKPVNPRRWLR